MPTVLITGANRGLGVEFVRQYAADGWAVHGGARHPESADILGSLPCEKGGSVTVHHLDVTQHDQISRLAIQLKGQSIDLLINNAGMWIGEEEHLGNFSNEQWMEQFRVHVFGTMVMCQAFTPHVALSDKKLIVNISSGNGSFGWPRATGLYPYDTSKAALNLVSKGLSNHLKDRGITVTCLTPGFVATDMGGPNADLQPRESVTGMRDVIAGLTLEQTGTFIRYNGEAMPW